MSQDNLNLQLSAPPMIALLMAQFLSALADNALLIAAIALLKIAGQADHISWIQAGFVLPFIVLAPFVGAFADAFPKGKVMLIGNAVKLLGTCLMLLNTAPVVAYLVVGIGATIYSPAKFGILSRFFNPQKLIKANGWLEGSTIVAILLGVVLGGVLADKSLTLALISVMIIYAIAAMFNLLIPNITPEYRQTKWRMGMLLREFSSALRLLVTNPAARVSLIGTSLFWGSGAALRLMLFVWVPAVLGIYDNQTPANLMGALSIGIVIGAALAATMIKLEKVRRAYVGGLMIGPIILLLSMQTSLLPAMTLLIGLGISGGLFVVPFNALLQRAGHQTVGVGHALAIQNFFENITMFLLVGVYGLLAHMPITQVIAGFGGLMLVGMVLLAWKNRSLSHL